MFKSRIVYRCLRGFLGYSWSVSFFFEVNKVFGTYCISYFFWGSITFCFLNYSQQIVLFLLQQFAALISLFIVMFVTHGRSRLTVSAFLGCSASVFVTILLAQYAVTAARLTGFASEESVYLNLATSGRLDFVALLIGGIIIR